MLDYYLIANALFGWPTQLPLRGVRRTGPAIRSPSYGPGIFNFFEGPYVAKFGP
jgi:hypothetical protein